jgi:hypothetical protein
MSRRSELQSAYRTIVSSQVTQMISVGRAEARGSGQATRPIGANAGTTDERRSIDVRRWQREGLLEPGRRFMWVWRDEMTSTASIRVQAGLDRVLLAYRLRSTDQGSRDLMYAVHISRTVCHLGGSRPWFTCPARDCGRRVAILYEGAIFACRQCLKLTYRSTRERPDERAMRRTDKIRSRLGWKPGILNRLGGKPKWMRWRTFVRLHRAHDLAFDRALEPLRGAPRSHSRASSSPTRRQHTRHR